VAVGFTVAVAFMAGLVAADSAEAEGSVAVADSAEDSVEAVFAVDFVEEDFVVATADIVVGMAAASAGDMADSAAGGAAEDFVAASAVSAVDSAVASAVGSVAEASEALTGSTAPSSAIDSAASDSTSMTLMILLLRRGSLGLDTMDIPIRTTGATPTVTTPASLTVTATATIRTPTVPHTIRLPMGPTHTLRR